MLKHILIVLIVLTIIPLSSCYKQADTNYQEDFYINSNIEKTIESIKNQYLSSSELVVSPDNKRLVFISPFEWEDIGELYICNFSDNKIDKLLSKNEIKPQHSPKKVMWFDNDIILIIIGYAFGTVDLGGELFYSDVDNMKINKVDTINLTGEIKDISIDNEKIHIEIIEYNDDSSDFKLYNKVKELNSIEIDSIWDFEEWENEEKI